eukprot:246289-Pleurochrysis_carterae.AAC.1
MEDDGSYTKDCLTDDWGNTLKADSRIHVAMRNDLLLLTKYIASNAPRNASFAVDLCEAYTCGALA